MRNGTSIAPVDLELFDFSIAHRRATVMRRSHRHNDLELIVVEDGAVKWMFGGTLVEVPENCLAVRWAAVPHRCVKLIGNPSHTSLKLPLAWLLSWHLPSSFLTPVFEGEHIIDTASDKTGRDIALMHQWCRDFETRNVELQQIVLLEVEARIRRLAFSMSEKPNRLSESAPRVRTSISGLGKVEQMAAFITQHYTEPLQMSDIAEAVQLNPRYAMGVFRQAFGKTMHDFVTHFRVWHA